MKKLICLALCLLALCALFSGCKENNQPAETTTAATLPVINPEDVPDGTIHYCGLQSAGVTKEQLAAAIGIDPATIIFTTLGSGEELLIANDVLFGDILYKQLQCINYADKSVITLTYIPQDEEVDDVINGIANSLEPEFGAPNSAQTGDGLPSCTWHSADGSENYVYLYPLTEEEFKLSFYLY